MNQPSGKISRGVVCAVGVLLIVLTAVLFSLAKQFPYGQPPNRPIQQVVYLSWFASAVALLGLFFGLRVKTHLKSLVGVILLVAVATRLLLVLSNPILEVDYYRYLWDGIAANHGIAPYKYSPDAVLRSNANDPELKVLQAAIQNSQSAFTIVSRVHFEEYTTLYPPVSQAVFRATTALVPDDASVNSHIRSIKFALVLFDFGTIAAIGWMLFLLKKHPAWLMAYAWNPLVLKEIANGGHLDSIAIFFMAVGIAVFLWIACRLARLAEDRDKGHADETASLQVQLLAASVGSALLMACGVGAKLFPIIFVPAMGLFLLARGRFKCAFAFEAAFILGVGLAMWPMFNPDNKPVSVQISQTEAAPDETDGLAAFMTRWRMNDAIFSGIYQNVEYDDWRKDGAPWYVVVPNEKRVEWFKEYGNQAYYVARLVTVGLFCLFYHWVVYRVFVSGDPEDLINVLFLIIGVFFYLQPTQNPWYWVWAMPLVCFAKNKGWLFISLILFVYYLRFWFTEQAYPYQFMGTKYVGHDFFDHCLVWVEFMLVLAILFGTPIATWLRNRSLPAEATDVATG